MLHFNYLLFDAARAERNLYRAMELNPDNKSLYKGWAEDDLAGVAPYLFSVKPDSEFMRWYITESAGQSWGIPFFANAAFEDIYKHFRQFLMVKTEEGQQLYFRFYDPRVLRIFLPTCDEQQIKEIFGPIKHFIVEDEEPGMAIQFWQENYILKSKPVSLTLETEPEKQESVSQKEPYIEIKNQAPVVDNTNIEAAPAREKKKWKFDID